MDSHFHSLPLNRICYQDSTFLLEAMLPYVAPQMKLPLAIFVKYTEFKRMLQVFQNPKSMVYYGLQEHNFSMENLLHTCSCCPNPTLAEQLGKAKQMLQMMQMAEAMQSMQEFGDLFADATDDTVEENDFPPTPQSEGPSLDEIIEQIFKEGEST